MSRAIVISEIIQRYLLPRENYNLNWPFFSFSPSDMKMMDGHMMPADNSIAMMMMQMYFYAGVDCTVLIKAWKVNCYC